MGPEGGSGGGTVVAEGTPEEVAQITASHTGRFLQEVLAGSGRFPAPAGKPKPQRTAATAKTSTKAKPATAATPRKRVAAAR